MTTSGTSARALSERFFDPVCGMDVVPGQTKLVTIYNGRSYWFCAEACRKAFEMDPRKYLESENPKKRKGWFGRYFDRMAKANKEAFGGGKSKCH